MIFQNLFACAKDIAVNGPFGFFKVVCIDLINILVKNVSVVICIYSLYTIIVIVSRMKHKISFIMFFLQGFIPAFVRLGPQTVLTFLFFEQIRLRFGRDVPV